MKYISTAEFADKHGISERTARNYCNGGKIDGAFLTGKTWNIPHDAALPARKISARRESALLTTLREQKSMGLKGGIYHKLQIALTYNSNHMEGSRLTEDQTRLIFETRTVSGDCIPVDDVQETSNHFRCVDMVIDCATQHMSEKLILTLHGMLKSGTSDALKSWFAVGAYKLLENEVGGRDTTPPHEVAREVKRLIRDYNKIKNKQLDDILDFHHRFECIHPFQDGNGRIGRLLMLKECLAHGIVPFIITDALKGFYYRGLQHWPAIPGYLRDTCLTAQDSFKDWLVKFRIPFR